MKKILITGANSYIGTSFEKYISKWPEAYHVDTLDVIDKNWYKYDFSDYDVVFHVAGIAHIKETKENSNLYYEVNRDLVEKVAKKAKESGIKQFIFLSSMSIYGLEMGVITKDTIPNPKTNYGKSKLQAEERIKVLTDDSFKVCILRPPMVYGKDCKGNYQTLLKLVKLSPVFPKVNNSRSMVHIDNLSSYVKLLIDKESSGLFFPQDKQYINTTDMALQMAQQMNKKLYLSKTLGIAVKMMFPFFQKARKAFGSLIYQNIDNEINNNK